MSQVAALIILAIIAVVSIWYFRPELVSCVRRILRRLFRKTDSNINPVSDEIKRWIVVGICLNKVLTPALRNVLATEIPKWYLALCQPPTEIHKQVSGLQQKTLAPSKFTLNYKNINNNDRKLRSAFDYNVKDPLSLVKLFVKPFMSKFTGFDQTMDASAVLLVIGEAAPFAGAAAPFAGAAVHAKTVRSDIRNEWAHCNFANWTEGKFETDFQTMEKLLKSVKLSSEDEQKLCDELNFWRSKGLQLCFGKGVDVEMLSALQDHVGELCEAVKTWNVEKEEMSKLSSKITQVQSDLAKEIDYLHARMKKCDAQVDKNSKEIKSLEKKFTTELSRINIKEEERIPYVFTAPPRNRYFSGRNEEIQELKRILKVGETMNEKKVRVAAVSGLGGIGKTSLVSEYAHQMKDFYKGGVYWFSAEDNTFLDKTVNDIALKIRAVLSSFDLTLSSILEKVSSLNDPSLIVLDCVDQLELSPNTMKFLYFPSQENIFGHFVILTRRNPNLLIHDVSVLEHNCCLELTCFKSAEAKQFLLSRTRKSRDDKIAQCLCEELGELPLALEQAGAYIQMRGCSLSSYLEQYKAERLRLLGKQRSRPVLPGKQSPERLAVHTTWLLNLEYVKNSQNGPAAVRFMNASSFFNGNEIEEELINIGIPEVEDEGYRECLSSPLGRCEILKLLTDFSLFTYVQAHSVRTHRLVQEFVRETFDPKSKAESFTDAVRMLSYAFSKCHSPGDRVSSHGDEQTISVTNLPGGHSMFYLWSKFCTHGHYVRKEGEHLLVSLNSVRSPETSKILYECAVHLSANNKQVEAKRVLNLAYRMLDWLSSAKYKTVKKIVSNNSLFPLALPLLRSNQMVIEERCMRPSLQALSDAAALGASSRKLKMGILKLKLDGEKSLKKRNYNGALDAFSSAIKLAQDRNVSLDPLLLINRATVNIELQQYADALDDANDYIIRRPECWRGYARKALSLSGLGEKVGAEIAAAVALYHNRAIFSEFLPFKESFLNLQKRIFICDYVDELKEAIFLPDINEGELKILVLGSEEYLLNFGMVNGPWNNCVLVGTRKNRSVCLKSNSHIFLLKCMLTNLSLCFNKGQLNCLPGSLVRMHNCNFSSFDVLSTTINEGELNAEQCNFANSNGSGLFCLGGNAVVVDCSFCNNRHFGLSMGPRATLTVKSSRMCNNGFSGLRILSSKCVVINCVICDNCDRGICIMRSKNIVLMRNSVFGNIGNGIFMHRSEVDIRENNIFDNGLWGIWSMDNSLCNLSSSKIFRNSAGGVCVEGRAESFPPSVIEMNEIYDNTGPGLVENVNKSAKFQDNEVYNNKENEMIGKFNLSIPYCSNCRKKCKQNICEKCFTSAYCSKLCRKKHSSKHDRICDVLRKKSSYLITSMETVGQGEVGPMFNPSPPKNGSRFIVKVHTVRKPAMLRVLLSDSTDYNLATDCNLVLHDQSRRLHKSFVSKFIYELVNEYGVLCGQISMEKKLFFYCLFEDNGQVRLFTNDFPKLQSW